MMYKMSSEIEGVGSCRCFLWFWNNPVGVGSDIDETVFRRRVLPQLDTSFKHDSSRRFIHAVFKVVDNFRDADLDNFDGTCQAWATLDR